MYVEFTRSGSDNCQVIFHHQHPEAQLEHFQEQFKDAGINIPISSIKKEVPAVATVPPSLDIVVTLEPHQYEMLIRQAFMSENARTPTVIDSGTF